MDRLDWFLFIVIFLGSFACVLHGSIRDNALEIMMAIGLIIQTIHIVLLKTKRSSVNGRGDSNG